MPPSSDRRGGDGWVMQAIQDSREEAEAAHKRLREETHDIWEALERKREKDEDQFRQILLGLGRLETLAAVEEKAVVRRTTFIASGIAAAIAVGLRVAEWWTRAGVPHP